ncbi:hypothetical protein Micbo1qcDRAFT_176780 [Microdochium bolleyi]|uniref:Uncharacterized protein n=1 Tax=Microdochium bolleyi TaxID=196109 RepID=A0A136IZ80_9PEZI|nr:hypothetical protein Micbo1qcDRAFT_176780 [Microdochium bolleyi]
MGLGAVLLTPAGVYPEPLPRYRRVRTAPKILVTRLITTLPTSRIDCCLVRSTRQAQRNACPTTIDWLPVRDQMATTFASVQNGKADSLILNWAPTINENTWDECHVLRL